jgi:hypothetical protein
LKPNRLLCPAQIIPRLSFVIPFFRTGGIVQIENSTPM